MPSTPIGVCWMSEYCRGPPVQLGGRPSPRPHLEIWQGRGDPQDPRPPLPRHPLFPLGVPAAGRQGCSGSGFRNWFDMIVKSI